ncbi:hypothetical protein INR49_022621 [Caranx melampygus]|nr:hypothetical protein INR49_022621 [Caranx melampygus]
MRSGSSVRSTVCIVSELPASLKYYNHRGNVGQVGPSGDPEQAKDDIKRKNKNKKKGKDEKYGSEVTTPENSSSPGMMDMHDDNSNQSSIADSSPPPVIRDLRESTKCQERQFVLREKDSTDSKATQITHR